MRVRIKKALVMFLQALLNVEFLVFGKYKNPISGKWMLKILGGQFEEPISLGHEFYLRNFGNITIGKYCSFGSFTRIWNYECVSVGDYFMSAGGLTINTAGHDVVSLQNTSAPVVIGKRVWIGQNVSILAGVTIGDDVVVAAGSVVVSDLEANGLYAGVPAKYKRSINRDADTIKEVEEQRRKQIG